MERAEFCHPQQLRNNESLHMMLWRNRLGEVLCQAVAVSSRISSRDLLKPIEKKITSCKSAPTKGRLKADEGRAKLQRALRKIAGSLRRVTICLENNDSIDRAVNASEIIRADHSV